MHNKINIEMHSIIQMKLYKGAILHMQGIMLWHCANQVSGKQLQPHTANDQIYKSPLIFYYALIEQSAFCDNVLQ